MQRTVTRTSRLFFLTPLLVMGICLCLVIVLAVGIGSEYISPPKVLTAISHGISGNLQSADDTIIWQMRLPRVLLAALVGAALAVSGAAFQGLFRNPLADPYLLGVASGAGFGATLVMVFAVSIPVLMTLGVPLAAFIGGLLSVICVVALARQGRTVPLVPLILAGVIIGSVLTAATSFVMLYSRDQALSVLSWLLGSFTFANWTKVFVMVPVLAVVFTVVLGSSRALNLLQLGEEQSAQLGLSVEKFKLLLIVVATLATSIAVSVSGIIGFVGLIIPHAVRLAMGADYRRATPMIALLGALFLVLADLLARTLIAPSQLPIGIITSLVGGPFFLYLLLLASQASKRDAVMLKNQMLAVKRLEFAYGKKKILHDVSFALQPKEIVGVIGPNGAGKSTLIKLLTKVLTPSLGEIVLNGQSVQKMGRLELARQLAVVPQSGELPTDYRVYDLVMMGRTPHLGFLAREGKHDHDLVQRVMQRTDVWQFRDRFASDLSGGEKQRVVLARALVQEPSYLLLDEPTNHLDLNYQIEVLSLVRQEVQGGLGALVVLHDLNLAARLCDRLLVMQQGSIVAEGRPSEILTEALVAQVYGANVSVVQSAGPNPVIVPNL